MEEAPFSPLFFFAPYQSLAAEALMMRKAKEDEKKMLQLMVLMIRLCWDCEAVCFVTEAAIISKRIISPRH